MQPGGQFISLTQQSARYFIENTFFILILSIHIDLIHYMYIIALFKKELDSYTYYLLQINQ